MRTNKLFFNALWLLAITPFLIQAQSEVELLRGWEYQSESGTQEKFNKVITSMDGTLIAVGEASQSGNQNVDGLFVVIDPESGERLFGAEFGGAGHDAFSSVVQNHDGTFTLVGYKEAGRRGGKQAWILSVDLYGEVLLDEVLSDGDMESSEFVDVAVNREGDMLATGMDYYKTGQSAWVLPLQNSPIFDKTLIGGMTNPRVNAVTAGEDGHFVLVGNTFSPHKAIPNLAWAIKMDRKGLEIWDAPVYLDSKSRKFPLDITSAPLAGGYAITGYVEDGRSGKEDIWLATIDENGEGEQDYYFGGKDSDIGVAVIELSEGGYAISGHTKSHLEKAAHSVLNLIVTDEYGLALADKYQTIFAGTGDNLAHSIVELLNGEEIVICGSSVAEKGQGVPASFLGPFSYKLRDLDAYGLDGTDEGRFGSNSEAPLTLSAVSFSDADGDQRLELSERGYFAVDLSNKTDQNLFDVRGKISADGDASGLDYWSDVMVGTLAAGKSKRMLIPVQALGASNESAKLNIDVAVAGVVKARAAASIGSLEEGFFDEMDKGETPSAPPPQLSVSNFNFTPAVNPRPGQTVKLLLELINKGGSSSPVTSARFILPEGVQAASESTTTPRIAGIRPGETKTVTFYFTYEESYRGNNIRIEFETSRQGNMVPLNSFLNLPIQSRGRADVPDEIFWVTPDPDEQMSRTIDVNDREIDLKVISLSTREQNKRNFAARVNGRRPQGQKMGESTLSPPTMTGDGRRSKRTYSTRIELEEGINEVEVVYLEDGTNGEVTSKSRTLTFRYIPRDKPNLHVLSIGIQHDDLDYTVKDAHDFADIYARLANNDHVSGFKKIEVMELTESSETAALNLRKAFENLKRWKIKDGDLLVIFISTHGKVVESGDYILVPSDFDPLFPNVTGLDFEEDVLKKLRMIDGNKLVFVDACHSGMVGTKSSSDDASSKVMNDLIRATSGLEIFASCSDSEYSYEDSSWNNGAFTKAILEAFNNEKVEIADGEFTSADVYADNPLSRAKEEGKDGVITIGELREFLQLRVPYLVRKAKGKRQNPSNKTAEHIDENTGIFIVH